MSHVTATQTRPKPGQVRRAAVRSGTRIASGTGTDERTEADGAREAMLTSIFQSTSIPILEQVVNFSQARHGVLAGNLANLDTPGYRVRDLSPEKFQQELKEAIGESRRAGLQRSPGDVGYDAFRRVKETTKSILYHDQSDVSIEQQVTEMVKNQMQHNMALTIMTKQFRLLQAAISEQVT